MALGVMAEYVEAKAAKEVPLWGTRYLVPWFVIQKTEPQGGEKFRLISDCREINQKFIPKIHDFLGSQNSETQMECTISLQKTIDHSRP